MKVKYNIFNVFVILTFISLFGLKAFAQPNPGIPNHNAGNNPWTNNGNGNNIGNNSQASTNNNSSNQLSVTIGEFYSLSLSNDNATILLDSEEKFMNGSESQPIEMYIFSSKKYSITAKVSSENFNGTADNKPVKTNNIDLNVSKKSGNHEAKSIITRSKNLKTFDEEIALSNKATKKDVFELVYSIPTQNTSAFLDQFGKTITTEIIYTLLPL